jgi:hypothetical protein
MVTDGLDGDGDRSMDGMNDRGADLVRKSKKAEQTVKPENDAGANLAHALNL